MRRIPWDILLAFLAGIGLGLVYAWMVHPLPVVNAEPSLLRTDFKDQFRSAIAAAYTATGNLPRAQVRLSLLDADPIEALNSQAQRTIANGHPAQADQFAALAFALQNGINSPVSKTPLASNVEPTTSDEPTNTSFPTPVDSPVILTETPKSIIDTPIIEPTSIQSIPTPRPTHTPIPTQGAPFTLTSQESVCDPSLPDGLLQVMVFNSSRRQLAGIKIIITWDSGEEQFFTGLKPELGNGYADYIMSPNTAYTLQLGLGSDIATNLVAPACQMPNGESYLGGFKLTFQQP